MNKELLLSKKTFIRMRSFLCFLSICFITFSFLALIFGYIMYMDNSFNAIAAIKNAFSILKLGKRPAMECILSTGFSVLYFVVIYNFIVMIKYYVKSTKKWLKSNEDEKISRTVTKQLVDYTKTSVLFLLILQSVSTILSGQAMNNIRIALTVTFIVFSVILNVLLLLLFDGKIAQDILKAIIQGVVLSTIIVFPCICTRLQVLDALNSLSGNFFLLTSFQSEYTSSFGFIALNTVEGVVIPVFNIIVYASLIVINYKIINFEFVYKGQMSVKPHIIRNIVFVVVSIIAVGYLNEYYNQEYFKLINENLPTIFVTLILGIYSLTLDKRSIERPYYQNEIENQENGVKVQYEEGKNGV